MAEENELPMQDETYTEAQREYREVYLRSDHWREVRKAALERADHRCQVCNGSKQLDVHHRTYERKGCEEPGDLTVLCRRCHATFHGASKVARTKRPPKSRPKAPVAADNWSRFDAAKKERYRAEFRCILLDHGRPGLSSKRVARLTGYRTQVVGACFVSLHRDGHVFKLPNGKRWSLTTQGQHVAVDDAATSRPIRKIPLDDDVLNSLRKQMRAA